MSRKEIIYIRKYLNVIIDRNYLFIPNKSCRYKLKNIFVIKIFLYSCNYKYYKAKTFNPLRTFRTFFHVSRHEIEIFRKCLHDNMYVNYKYVDIKKNYLDFV